MLDEAAKAQAEADGWKRKLQTSEEELSSTNDKLASLKTAFQVVNKEKDDAISQLKSLQKESENRNNGKMGKKGVEKDDFSDDYFQIQCDRLKKYVKQSCKL